MFFNEEWKNAKFRFTKNFYGVITLVNGGIKMSPLKTYMPPNSYYRLDNTIEESNTSEFLALFLVKLDKSNVSYENVIASLELFDYVILKIWAECILDFSLEHSNYVFWSSYLSFISRYKDYSIKVFQRLLEDGMIVLIDENE